MAQIQEKLLGYLPPVIKNLVEGSSRRALLKNINTTFLLFENQLIHLESGKIQELPELFDSNNLAAASRQILDTQAKDSSILLLLPPRDFIGTLQEMPGVTRESLVSALRLQTDALLPSFEEPLALAVNPESADTGSKHVALWLTQNKLHELFSAFESQGLFLAAVRPRILNLGNELENYLLLDRDSQSHTAALFESGVLKQWQQINTVDLEHEAFTNQWQQFLDKVEVEKTVELDCSEKYLESASSDVTSEYSFFPAGALNARKKIEKGKRVVLAAAVFLVFILLGSIPFILQTVELSNANTSLSANREMSQDARQDQSAVVNFENEWGAISDFPEQNVREAMYTLQNVLSPDQLSSLEISEGLIKIQGTSSDPQAILQRLEQDPLFTEVVFSRATNNTRYYIDLRLAPVNFEAYMVRYFPDD